MLSPKGIKNRIRKPNWAKAPKWANWLAMDSDFEWFWYESKPTIIEYYWHEQEGRCQHAGNIQSNIDHKKTLERRPKRY